MSVQPRRAVACILVRGERNIEVLMAQRNPSLRFMPGHHVFPGGTIDPTDGIGPINGADDADHAAMIEAAAREVFEETGLMCARGTLPHPQELRTDRESLWRGDLHFQEILKRHGLTLFAEDFALAGMWVTPTFSKMRYATQYLLHRVRDDQVEELIEGEIVGLEWLTPRETRRRWHRGSVHLSAPVAYTLQLLAAAPLQDAIPMLIRGTERTPGDHNRFEIRRGLTIIPLKSATIPPATHTNCVIVGEEKLLVIDPGSDDPVELRHLFTQLEHLIELGAEVEAILLTHSHPDHIGGVPFLKERFDLPIWAHSVTAEQVEFTVDRHIADNEVLRCPGDPDWILRAIHTPGHDPGHLCFVEQTTGALIAGDMVANPGSIVVSQAYRGDMAQFMRSLERLIDVDCKFIVPAHGMPLPRPQEQLQKHLAHRHWREERIETAYRSGATTFDALLKRAYDDIRTDALPLARHSLAAHLAKLGIVLSQG